MFHPIKLEIGPTVLQITSKTSDSLYYVQSLRYDIATNFLEYGAVTAKIREFLKTKNSHYMV